MRAALAFRAAPSGFRIAVDGELRLGVRAEGVLGITFGGLGDPDRLAIGGELEFT